MRIKKIRVKNFKSIKDSGDIVFDSSLFILAGQNESGKSSILEALDAFEKQSSDRDNLNFELEKENNFIQEIYVTFTEPDELFFDAISDRIVKLINDESPQPSDFKKETIFNIDEFKKIKDYTIKTIFDLSLTKLIVTKQLDKNTLGILQGCIKKHEAPVINSDRSISKEKQFYIDIDQYLPDISSIFWDFSPQILFFNDFTTLLPDKILVEDIEKTDIKGHRAVKNLEKLLHAKFADIAKKQIPQKNSTTESESKGVSANFQKDWQQKIFGNNKVNIKFFIENNDNGKKEISFFIETKDNEFLAPRKRSKGMIWFLSLWLELMAREDNRNLVLLFDEPGHHLHIKANKDMLSVFHRLIKKGHQIIYSTHSPALIELDNLHNIGLVVNSEKEGTLIEGLTTSKIDTSNKRDALQPIAEAMGLEPLREFSILDKNNVIVEGLSDYWYYTSMLKLLNRKSNYRIVPSIGIKINNVFPLISFCLGYGLNWLLIMENGTNPTQTRDELKEKIFNNNDNETDKKIRLIPYSEIENIFSIADLRLIDSRVSSNEVREPILIIGKSRKIVFSKQFAQKVDKGEIKKENLNTNTIQRFEEIFDWIDKNLIK